MNRAKGIIDMLEMEAKTEVGDKYNYKGITWEVIKADSTQSKSKSLTKNSPGEAVHDTKIIVKNKIWGKKNDKDKSG